MRNLLNPRAWTFFFVVAFLAPAVQAACTYTVSPSGRNHGYGAATNTILVSAGTGCTWNVTNPNPWIIIQSGASGASTGTVTYAVVANTTINSRTGLVTIADQTFSVSQDGLPCNYSVTPTTRNHGSAGISNNPSFTVSSLTGCVWSVTTTSSWIFFTGITNSSGTNGVTYAVGANRIPQTRTGTVAVANQIFTLTQSAAPCIYDVHIPGSALTNRLHGYGGSTGLVTVEVTSGQQNCDWFVINTNTWISIIANPSGNGTGTFTYDVAPNPNALSRGGYLKVWNESFYVLQNLAPCNASFTPTSATTGADPVTNNVLVTLAGGCAWDVTNTNSWITVLPLTNNVGSGNFTYMTAGNVASTGRTGTVSVLGTNFFTIRQAAANCTYRLSPTNRVHGYGATSNSVGLTTPSVCSWTVVNTNGWVTILSPTNGQGDSTISYALSQNGGAGDRLGVVVIGGQPFSLTQHGVGCAINLSPSTRPHGYGAATNSVIVNTGAGCTWDAFTTNSWITILSNTNGAGSNIVSYAVTANPAGIARTGYLFIEDQSVTLIQAAAPCTFTFAPPNFLHSALQETGTVSVTSPVGCNWTVVNTNPWFTLLSSTNGTGSASVSYFVTTNLNPSARAGVLTIGGEVYSVIQDGVVCSYKVVPTNRVHGYAATTNFWTMTVSNPCPWSVVNTNSWITILSGSSGAGTGVVTYALSANNASPDDRIGAVVMGGQVSLITQHGLGCGYSIAPMTRAHGFGAASNAFTVTTGPACAWSAGNTNSWVQIISGSNGPGNGTVAYTVEANLTLEERIAQIAVDGQTFIITQAASSCAIDLTPGTRNHGFSAATNSVSVTTALGCPWTVANTNSWISIVPGWSGSGTGTVTYSVVSNLNPTARSGNVTIGGTNFLVSQSAYLCNYKLSPTNRTHGFGANTGLVSITAGAACAWTLVNTNDWIAITTPTSGSGNSNFTYTIQPNFGSTTRAGSITLDDETLTLSQLPASGGFVFESIVYGLAGDVTVRLAGGPPGIWEIQRSADLTNWVKVADITNTTGRVEKNIPGPASTNRYFRAVLP